MNSGEDSTKERVRSVYFWYGPCEEQSISTIQQPSNNDGGLVICLMTFHKTHLSRLGVQAVADSRIKDAPITT